ncbi:MAG TPA: HEAT repeat domain-containing protein [Malonomonas sp.]
MNQSPEQRPFPEKNQQLLADFIHELNLARRSFSLYPPEHPQIASRNSKALQLLLKLQTTRETLTIGVSPGSLFVDQQWLDKNNRIYSQFARFLFDLGIASLSFSRGLVFSELLRFNQLLRGDRESIEAAGGFPTLLEMQQISHIVVTPIDYSAFRARTTQGVQAADNQSIWEGFLQGLLSGSLDARGESADWPGHLDPAIIAEALNQRLSEKTVDPAGCKRVASSLVTRLLEDEPEQDGPSGQQLGSLIEQLDPQLRESFLTSSLETLDRTPDRAEQVLKNLPEGLLSKTLQVQSQRPLNISSRLISLVGQLATTSSQTPGYNLKSGPKALEEEVVLARLNVLFNEESQDLYMPGGYQHALQDIFDMEQFSSIPEEEKLALKATLEQQSIERQCCAIIFELLDSPLTAESEITLQHNLVELSRFFLDTGDFVALKEIYRRWSKHLNGRSTQTTVFDEMVLAHHHRPAFMTEVLDGVELWGKEKVAEIGSYIELVGEGYSEPLIERLGLEQQLTLRRTWMRLLETIGSSAQQVIIPALNDKRWYLVRNLLNIIGQKPDLAAMKAIQQQAGHPHPKVRQEVLSIMFRLNPAGANRQLQKELRSNDPEARLAAVEIADLSRDPEIVAILLQLLQGEPDSSDDLSNKQLLLKALSRIGSPDSLPVLKNLLQKKRLIISRRQKQFQQDIITSLAGYPQKLALPLLKELSRSRQAHQAKLAAELLQTAGGGQ